MSRLQGRVDREIKNLEEWKVDHLEAMECIDFEEWIATGLVIFDTLNGLADTVEKAVYVRNESIDTIRKLFINMLVDWKQVAESNVPVLRDFASRYTVVGKEKFEDRIAKVDGLIGRFKDAKPALAPSSHMRSISDEEAEEVENMINSNVACGFAPTRIKSGKTSLIKFK